MTYKTKGTRIRWITVPLDATLHADVRTQQVRLGHAWPTVVAEAMRLWLADQTKHTT